MKCVRKSNVKLKGSLAIHIDFKISRNAYRLQAHEVEELEMSPSGFEDGVFTLLSNSGLSDG
jgi:hypothetical protein